MISGRTSVLRLADACAAGPVAVSEELVAALFSLSESMDFFIRRLAF